MEVPVNVTQRASKPACDRAHAQRADVLLKAIEDVTELGLAAPWQVANDASSDDSTVIPRPRIAQLYSDSAPSGSST